MPEGPAVAGRQALHLRPDPVDRCGLSRYGHRPVGPHMGDVAASRIGEFGAGLDQPASIRLAKGTRGSDRLPAWIVRLSADSGSTAAIRRSAASI